MIGGLLVFTFLPLATGVAFLAAPQRGWREAAMWAALAWGTGVLILTEVLGGWHALAFGPVLVLWLVVHAGGLVMVWRGRARFALPVVPRAAWLLLFWPALALATALLSPPNTADALSYHLPRQAMWLQQHGLDHFLTVNDRALMMPPLAEMIQAHALLLSGNDRWANLPQWSAYGLGMIAVSLLARELGGGRRAQWLAAVAFATLPMAWHQAASAKNDLLVAVWLALFLRYALRLRRADERSLAEWIAGGLALGLALATKSTALVYGAPILPLLAGPAWRAPWRAALLGLAAAVLVAPHALRNLAWYGTPLGIHRAEDGGEQAVVAPTLRGTASNLLRNATLHLATPWPEVNREMFAAVRRVHGWFDGDMDDPRTTLWHLHYGVDWGPRDEMIAGAPMHALLGLAALAALVGGLRRTPGACAAAVVVVVGGVLLVCVMLKWQPAGARLHLPVFVVLAALIAVVAEAIGPRTVAFVAGACVLGWLPSWETSDRPLWTAPQIWAGSRWQNYFRFDPAEAARQEACVRALVAAKVTSLQIVSRHGFPWPLMRRWQSEVGSHAKFWGALPESAHTPPDGVLVLEDLPHAPGLRPPNSREPFVRVGQTGPYALYVPESRAAALRP